MELQRAESEAVDQERWLLRFRDTELETRFRRDYDASALPRVRLAGVLAIVLYAAFGFLDTLAVDGDVGRIWLIRAAVVLFFAVEVIASYSPLADRIAPLVQQPALFVSAIVSTLGLDLMNVQQGVPSDYAYSGTMLILIFVCTFVRVRFTICLAAVSAVVFMYEVSEAIRGVDAETAVFNNFFLLAFVIVGVTACHALEALTRQAYWRESLLAREHARSDALLHNILPVPIADRLRKEHTAIADAVDEVTVLFADIVGFTPFAARVTPTELVGHLDRLFSAIDGLCELHGVEKIKTIGDAYMAVAGAPTAVPDHAGAVAELALDLRDLVVADATSWPRGLQIRIGVCSGPVVAGVIGRHKFAYDLWGDTVNTAARMESHGVPGTIHVAASTRALLGDRYRFTDPVEIDIKGKGLVTTHLLLDRA